MGSSSGWQWRGPCSHCIAEMCPGGARRARRQGNQDRGWNGGKRLEREARHRQRQGARPHHLAFKEDGERVTSCHRLSCRWPWPRQPHCGAKRGHKQVCTSCHAVAEGAGVGVQTEAQTENNTPAHTHTHTKMAANDAHGQRQLVPTLREKVAQRAPAAFGHGHGGGGNPAPPHTHTRTHTHTRACNKSSGFERISYYGNKWLVKMLPQAGLPPIVACRHAYLRCSFPVACACWMRGSGGLRSLNGAVAWGRGALAGTGLVLEGGWRKQKGKRRGGGVVASRNKINTKKKLAQREQQRESARRSARSTGALQHTLPSWSARRHFSRLKKAACGDRKRLCVCVANPHPTPAPSFLTVLSLSRSLASLFSCPAQKLQLRGKERHPFPR
jgi:hypothetical protein